MMNIKKLNIIQPVIAIAILFASIALTGNESKFPEHIAYNIKAERIPLSSGIIKVTWEMNRNFSGDFVVGRSESPLNSINDILKSTLVGIFNPALEGFLIDRDIQLGKDYYYIVISKEKLLKREINILRDVNVTSSPVSIHPEPEMVKSIKAESRNLGIRIRWDQEEASGLKFNVYRSPSAINSAQELHAASRLATTKDNTFTDNSVPEFGTYYYAVTVTDKNNLEYFTPISGENFTNEGTYIKEKTISTPLNVSAFSGTGGSIIIKWLKAGTKTDRELDGYEIYRSSEIINSQFNLKNSQLIHIAGKETTFYTDPEPGAGKFYYAVFPRYSNGRVDVNFDTAEAYTRFPVYISTPYRITGIKAEKRKNEILLIWEFSGNMGDEILKVIRSDKIPGTTDNLGKYTIGSVNINQKNFTINEIDDKDYHYGLFAGEKATFVAGVNITAKIPASSAENSASGIEVESAPRREPAETNNSLNKILKLYFDKGRYELASKELDKFIKNTDNNRDRVLAKLFLGKASIELKEYEKAILILNSIDVTEAFPEESKFWSNFALLRLR